MTNRKVHKTITNFKDMSLTVDTACDRRVRNNPTYVDTNWVRVTCRQCLTHQKEKN